MKFAIVRALYSPIWGKFRICFLTCLICLLSFGYLGGHALNIFGTGLGNFREMSRTFPGQFREISGKFPP